MKTFGIYHAEKLKLKLQLNNFLTLVLKINFQNRFKICVRGMHQNFWDAMDVKFQNNGPKVVFTVI